MKPMEHQIKFAIKMYKILKERGYVYLAGKPRSGKTYTAILCCELSNKINNILVLTPKKAINGWLKFTENNPYIKHNYYVTNYEQLGKIKGGIYEFKINKDNYDLVIIDESHNIGSFPKPSNRHRLIKAFCWDKPHIHLSGTAIVESPNSIYHQMHISKYSPFRYKNFYEFFRVYGIPRTIRISGREIIQYNLYKPELLQEINKFTVYMTQEDAGIDKDLQAVDKLHYVELLPETKALYNKLQKTKILQLDDKLLVCDTIMKLRTSLHMLESGVLKIDDEYIELGNTEKINYIKNTWGDRDDMGIMCHFIGEQKLFAKHFKKAKIFSSKAYAEGVDLSFLKHFIIVSSDYSGAKFIQRRERIINTNGTNTNIVNHILVKNAISEQVYKTVSKKQDFNNSTYIPMEI